MSDKRISQLENLLVSTANAVDTLPIVSGGTTKKVSLENLTLILTNLGFEFSELVFVAQNEVSDTPNSIVVSQDVVYFNDSNGNSLEIVLSGSTIQANKVTLTDQSTTIGHDPNTIFVKDGALYWSDANGVAQLVIAENQHPSFNSIKLSNQTSLTGHATNSIILKDGKIYLVDNQQVAHEVGGAAAVTATTGSVISFVNQQVYNSFSAPSSSNITDDLSNAKIGVVQKIYHTKSTAPTFPAGWVLMGENTYTPNTLNVIRAEWVGGSRVEYWIMKPLNNYTARTNAYAMATGITDSTILDKVNAVDLGFIAMLTESTITSLIAAKQLVWYPMKGGSASTCKYNFFDPRDADDAFRLTFYGGWTFDSQGAIPNGTNAYADTHFVPFTNLSVTSNHVSFYSFTDSDVGIDVMCSETDGENYFYNFGITSRSSNTFQVYNGDTSSFASNLNGSGFYSGGKSTGSNNINLHKNGAVPAGATIRTSIEPLPNATIKLASNSGGTAGFSNKKNGSITIGTGLTPTQHETLSTLITTFNS